MLERVIFSSVHTCAHVFLYRIPRWLHQLFIRLPVTLWELISGKRPLTYRRQRERHIKVVASATDAEASRRLLHTFGLEKNMTYDGPLYSGHVQTILGALRPSRRVQYTRELLEAADGNPICLDWLKVPPGKPVKGIILLIPGLGNYGQSNYIQRFSLCAARRGYHCCILTPRGMGSAPLTTSNITCVTFTDDIHHVLQHRLHRAGIEVEFHAPLPLFAVGYSCGGSTLIKAIAEATSGGVKSSTSLAPVDAAVVMTAPVDMEVSAHMLCTPMGRLLYAKPIFTALKKYLRKHKKAIMSISSGKSPEERARLPLFHVDFDAAMAQITKPADVDKQIVATHFGYKDEVAYYRDGDAFPWLQRIQEVPVLCINTHDDPIVGYGITSHDWRHLCAAKPNVAYMELPSGGHFGFLQGPFAEWRSLFSPLQTIPLNAIDHFVSTRGERGTAL